MTMDQMPHPASLWAATMAALPPFAPLRSQERVDVAVVGGGLTGLSAALHLAEGGARVALVEAHQPGWGASGLNGGQIIPGLKYDPDALETIFGPDYGPRVVAFAGGTADLVFSLAERLGLDCDAVRSGWIMGATSAGGCRYAAKKAEEWERRGAPVAFLNAQATADHIGTHYYRGGFLDRRGGHLHPLKYVQGLAQAVQAAGGAIYGDTPARRIVRDGSEWAIETTTGRLLADQVILGTAAYTDDLWPGLKRSFVATTSLQVATVPLNKKQRASILPHDNAVSETRNLLFYYRLDRDGRLVMGGSGAFADPAPADFAHIESMVPTLFPQLRGVELQHRWFGRFANTPDHLPHLHELAPGVSAWLGCNGRGVALSTALGKELALQALGRSARELALPVNPVKAIPLHGLQSLYVALATQWYRLLDAVR